MRWLCKATGMVFAVAAAGFAAPLASQTIELTDRPFNEQVLRPHGQPVVPVYEGWYETPEGTKRICFGYLNPNTVESVDIPLGAGNVLSPAKWDGIQPTHFRPVPETSYRRDYCVFTIEVGDDFTTEDRIFWTLQSRGGPLTAPGHILPAYELDDLASSGLGDVAPEVRVTPGGPPAIGRTGRMMDPITVRVGAPVEIPVWVKHPRAGSWVIWANHAGPGTVAFAPSQTRVDAEGKATASATFDKPGEYLLRVQSINSLGSFDFYCCWTNAYLPVTVVQ